MKKHVHLIEILIILAVIIITAIFFGCTEQVTQVCQNPTSGSTGNITGKVFTTNNAVVSGLKVISGTVSGYTNEKGEYFLSGVPVGDRVLVNFISDNYAPTQKVVLVKAGRTSYINAAVILVTSTQSLNAKNGGSISFSGAKVDFPANSLVDSKGAPFTGSATVKATYFNPTASVFLDCFPGEFKGVRPDNSETQIESFGFINVRILNGTENLQIATGKNATITLPIPVSIQSKAPQSIPLWYYDETLGKWLEEGLATKTGTNYVGTVKHFSSWNCDMPTLTSYLTGKVVDKNGDPVSFAVVHTSGVDYTGSSRVNTDDSGHFKISVKSSSTAKVWASYYVFSSDTQNITTPATGDVQDIGTLTINIDTTNICTVIGRYVDNGNNPVKSLYLHLLDSLGNSVDIQNTDQNGKFKFFTSLSSKYSIQVMTGIDSMDANKIITFTTSSKSETMDLGDIKLDIGGSTLFGRVVDSTGAPIANVMYYTTDVGRYGENKNSRTDSTGKFSVWVRPNINFQIIFYAEKQVSKTINVTSGNLGDTQDLGDITVP